MHYRHLLRVSATRPRHSNFKHACRLRQRAAKQWAPSNRGTERSRYPWCFAKRAIGSRQCYNTKVVAVVSWYKSSIILQKATACRKVANIFRLEVRSRSIFDLPFIHNAESGKQSGKEHQLLMWMGPFLMLVSGYYKERIEELLLRPSYNLRVSWLFLVLRVHCFFGDANRLPSVELRVICASALGKCRLQTQWWSLITTSWRPCTSNHRSRFALSWGKQCIDTLSSLARIFQQTMYVYMCVSPGVVATPELRKYTQ